MLLMALLATDSLTDTVEHTKILAKLKSDSKHCPLTGKKTFGAALTAILASQELANRVGHFQVLRGTTLARGVAKSQAAIIGKAPWKEDSFFGWEPQPRQGLSVRAMLMLPHLAAIARDLTEWNK